MITNKNIILIFVLIIGAILRIYYSFFSPTYNVDEIALGLNIKNCSFIDIVKPFKNYQSAPPLYLIIQKCIFSLPLKTIIVGKIISFFISIGILYLSYKIAVKKFIKSISKVVFLSFFSFSPFVLYNTLTLKQYGMDLFFLLLVFQYFEILNLNRIKGAIVLSIWCLVSNIGLFFTAGFMILRLISFFRKKNRNLSVLDFLKVNWVYAIGGIFYVLFFIWFLQQPYGLDTKIFMQNYWKGSFIPLDFSILRYLAYFMHGLSVFFFSSYLLLGYLLIGFYLIILLSLRNLIFSSPHGRFLIGGLCVHLIFNLLHLYPLSDRLYLYLAVFMILPISVYLDKNWGSQKIRILVIFNLIFIFISWISYAPFRENDVIRLTKELDKYGSRSIFFTPKAYNDISRWYEFTDMEKPKSFTILEKKDFLRVSNDEIIVSRVQHKFGHEEKTSKEEKNIEILCKHKKVGLIQKVDGYNIYRSTKI
jgi:hypothetical protein